MSKHIFKRHNKTLLLYHIVCPLKYRKKVITRQIGKSLKEICLEISERYEIHLVEVGYESDHVHFLVQSVPSLSISEITRTIKSISAKELFRRFPEIEANLWGGNIWTSGYYANEEVIRKYVEKQGKAKEYKRVCIL